MVQSLLIKYKLMWIYRSSRSWNRLMTFLPNNMSWDLGNIHTRRILKRKWDQNDICLSPLITAEDRLFFFRKLIFLKGMFISMLWLLNYIFNAVHSHKIYKDNCKPFKECIFRWTWWYICKFNWHLKTFHVNEIHEKHHVKNVLFTVQILQCHVHKKAIKLSNYFSSRPKSD